MLCDDFCVIDNAYFYMLSKMQFMVPAFAKETDIHERNNGW